MVRIAASGATLNPVAAASPFGVKLLDREGRHHNQRSCSDLESDLRGDWRARCQGIENAQRDEGAMARVLPARGYGLTALVSQLSMGPDRLSRLSMELSVSLYLSGIMHHLSGIMHPLIPLVSKRTTWPLHRFRGELSWQGRSC